MRDAVLERTIFNAFALVCVVGMAVLLFVYSSRGEPRAALPCEAV